jgi:hypothetical protein
MRWISTEKGMQMSKRKCCDSEQGSGPHREGCIHCRIPKQSEPQPHRAKASDVKPDWTRKCVVCGASPIVPITGMCGPCTFGEADTILGDW